MTTITRGWAAGGVAFTAVRVTHEWRLAVTGTGGHGTMPALLLPRGAPMFEGLFGRKRDDAAVADRIPPGQYRTEKFPVLHYGSVPHTELATWDFRVWGEVDNPFTLTWDQFKALPRKT